MSDNSALELLIPERYKELTNFPILHFQSMVYKNNKINTLDEDC